MRRRTFLAMSLIPSFRTQLEAAMRGNNFSGAAEVLERATDSGRVHAAALYARNSEQELVQAFGSSRSAEDMFLIASISKPMSVAALMTLYDRGEFQLDDRVEKFIPEFQGDGRDRITIRQLLTHVSGLPDQLPENEQLRQAHAGLPEFTEGAISTPLRFEPGTDYGYSSMGILLASEIAHRISGAPFAQLMKQKVFEPLGMRHSELGLGDVKLGDTMRCQVESAAPESGAGSLTAKDWDWNSVYWRNLGSPWGGVHASASDVARFLSAFLDSRSSFLQPETSRMMVRNHNADGLTPRGLGFALGTKAFSPDCSENTFGHGGSTGTIAWADPESDTICVVLTTLPTGAAAEHPRLEASQRVAAAARP